MDDVNSASRGVKRRHLLTGGAVAGVGAALALGTDTFLSSASTVQRAQDDAIAAASHSNGGATIPFFGEHQAGVEVIPQAHQTLLALTLHDGISREDIRRMLRVLSDDAARLTQGMAALADSEPELATVPARLTITFGVGAELVARVSPPGGAPEWLEPLPAFRVDRLRDEWTGGDLLLQVAADDAVTVAHASRMLLKDSRTFASLTWVQTGFRRAFGSEKSGTTQRNLFGQIDGTSNVEPGSREFAEVVWQGSGGGPAWMRGGTGMVVRRIRMLLDKWDALDRSGREESVGRSLDTGAPLTGTSERDDPDFEATTALGFPVIADFAHIRRARPQHDGERMFRRVYNFDDHPERGEVSNSGLIFTTFQHNVHTQFVPVQQRLDDLDLLNEWLEPIGSAVFAILPGTPPGGFVGETLFG